MPGRPTKLDYSRAMRRYWVNIQCRCVLLNWIIVGQGPIALALGAGGGCLDFFLSSISSLLSPETARYRLKYCLKGPLILKQPTNQPNTKFLPKILIDGKDRKCIFAIRKYKEKVTSVSLGWPL